MNEAMKAVAQWIAADKALAQAKAYELECRAKMCSLNNLASRLGTNTLELPNGGKINVLCKNNYSLKNKQGETEAVLNYIEMSDPKNGPALAAACVRVLYSTSRHQVSCLWTGRCRQNKAGNNGAEAGSVERGRRYLVSARAQHCYLSADLDLR